MIYRISLILSLKYYINISRKQEYDSGTSNLKLAIYNAYLHLDILIDLVGCSFSGNLIDIEK